jgi:GH18 family chitinase
MRYITVLVLMLLSSLAFSQSDSFTYSDGTLVGRGSWVAVTGISNSMRVVSNAIQAPDPAGGLDVISVTGYNTKYTVPMDVSLKMTAISTGAVGGVDALMIFIKPSLTASSAAATGGYAIRSTINVNGFIRWYSHVGTGFPGTNLALTDLSPGPAVNDRVGIKVKSLSPFTATAYRTRGAATDSVDLTSTLYDLSAGYYVWIGSSSDSLTNSQWDDFSAVPLGAQQNSAPTLTLTVPATVDTGTQFTVTATLTDAGAGAGVDTLGIYKDGVKDSSITGLAGTTATLAKLYTVHVADTIQWYAEGRDDSLAGVREPTSGTKQTIVVAQPDTIPPPPPASGLKKWYYLYVDEVRTDVIPGSGCVNGSDGVAGCNSGVINPLTWDWTLGDYYISFVNSILSTGDTGNMLNNNMLTPSKAGPLNAVIRAANPSAKILVCFGGAGGAERIHTALADAAQRTKLAHQLKMFCLIHGYDGIDLDYEPTGTATWSGDIANIRLFQQELRDTFNTVSPPLLMSFFVYDSYGLNNMPAAGGDTCWDYWLAGNYDELGTWENFVWHGSPIQSRDTSGANVLVRQGGGSSGTTANSMQEDVRRLIAAGATPSKIVALAGINVYWYTGGQMTSGDPDDGVQYIQQPFAQASSPPAISNAPSASRYYNFWPNYLQYHLADVKRDTTNGLTGANAYISIFSNDGVRTNDTIYTFLDSISFYWQVQFAVHYGIGGVGMWNMGEGNQRNGTRPAYLYEVLRNLTAGITDTTTRSISSISPTSATAGGSNFTLTVNGSNFKAGDSVIFNGTYRVTTRVSASQLTAAILSADIATAGSKSVVVRNGTGVTSNTAYFTVTAAATAPVITAISSNNIGRGATAATRTITGTGFLQGMTVSVSGSGVTVNSATYVSATSYTLSMTVTDLASLGARDVIVANTDGLRDTLVNGLGIHYAPSFTSIAPDSIFQGTTINVTISGSHIYNNGTISLTFSGTGVRHSSVGGVGSVDTTLYGTSITADAGTTTGYRSMTIINSDDGRATFSNVIRVVSQSVISTGYNGPIWFDGEGHRNAGPPPFLTFKRGTALGTPKSRAGEINFYGSGYVNENGDSASTQFSLGLSGEGTYTASLLGGSGISVTRSGGEFTISSPLATTSQRGSLIGGTWYDVVDGVVTPKVGLFDGNWIGSIPRALVPAVYPDGVSGTIPVADGAGNVTWTTYSIGGGGSHPNARVYDFEGPTVSATVSREAAFSRPLDGAWSPWGLSDTVTSSGTSGYVDNVTANVDTFRQGVLRMVAANVPTLDGTARKYNVIGLIRASSSSDQFDNWFRSPDTITYIYKTPSSMDSCTYFMGKFQSTGATRLDTFVNRGTTNYRVGFEFGGSRTTTYDSIYAAFCDGSTQTRLGVGAFSAGQWDTVTIETASDSIRLKFNGVKKLTKPLTYFTATTKAWNGMVTWNHQTALVASAADGKSWAIDKIIHWKP